MHTELKTTEGLALFDKQEKAQKHFRTQREQARGVLLLLLLLLFPCVEVEVASNKKTRAGQRGNLCRASVLFCGLPEAPIPPLFLWCRRAAAAMMAEHTRLDYRELKAELARSKSALAIARKWWK